MVSYLMSKTKECAGLDGSFEVLEHYKVFTQSNPTKNTPMFKDIRNSKESTELLLIDPMDAVEDKPTIYSLMLKVRELD